MKIIEIIQRRVDAKCKALKFPKSMANIKNWSFTSFDVEEIIKDTLTDYTDFLMKAGYCDADIYCEGNSTIDRYMHPELRDK